MIAAQTFAHCHLLSVLLRLPVSRPIFSVTPRLALRGRLERAAQRFLRALSRFLIAVLIVLPGSTHVENA
jgi:hypothetical protein